MSIYFGSSKIGKVFVGSTEIAKVYHGSTLVFENLKKIPAYGYTGNNLSPYLLGDNSTNGVIIQDYYAAIQSISGTLGEAGSTVTFTDDPRTYGTYTYDSTKTYNGVKLHVYRYDTNNFWYAYFVIEDAKVGSICYGSYRSKTHGYSPESVGADSMTVGATTYTRAAANDTILTRNGLGE